MQSKRVNNALNKMIKYQEVYYNLLLNIPPDNVSTYGYLAKAFDLPPLQINKKNTWQKSKSSKSAIP